MNTLLQQSTNQPRDHVSQPARILVIDDDASVCAAIQAILTRTRCETVIASRAFDGITALQHSTFDVVMVDIFMPGLNGLDAIEHIRRESPMPIIAMSGFRLRNSAGSADHLGLAARRGATLCLRKPFTPVQLVEAVEWSRSRSIAGLTQGSAH
jgi:CheY-like chemotaxis protein